MNPNFSPADSLLSVPGDSYDSLFGSEGAVSPVVTALTPESLDDDCQSSRQTSSQPSSELQDSKKPVKKRKSWGQELPTPKTNLPPRKRAKTEDEKEQRRIERVLRNRAAAQSSRERKRKEVEGLEDEKRAIEVNNSMMESRLKESELENRLLKEQIARMAAEMTVFRNLVGSVSTDLPTPEGSSKHTSPAMSSSRHLSDPVPHLKTEFDVLDVKLPPPQSTVDPREASFTSPTDSPRVDPTATTPNLTQHPAEMLCDLQCQLGVNRPQWGPSSSGRPDSMERQRRLTSFAFFTTLSQILFMAMASGVMSQLVQPLTSIFHSLTTGSELPTPSNRVQEETLCSLILWLISTETSSPTPTTTSTTRPPSSSSPTRLPSPPRSTTATSTFQITLLRRLLACSPALARPLRDATGRALQLAQSSVGEAVTREVEDGKVRETVAVERRRGEGGGPVETNAWHVKCEALRGIIQEIDGQGSERAFTDGGKDQLVLPDKATEGHTTNVHY